MKGIFELRLHSPSVREQYKLNLHIPRKEQVVFGTKKLGSLGSQRSNSMPYNIKCAKNLNGFKNLIRKWNGSLCSCIECALRR